MASAAAQEKVGEAGLSITTTTACYHDKGQPLSESVSPVTTSGEKVGAVSRVSDVSTPASTRSPFDNDVEAMITTEGRDPRSSRECTKGGSDCQVWPGQDHWRRKAKLAKKNRRNCTFLGKLSKRNRIMVKILIGSLVIGVAVAVGFGVSKPLGAGIWKSNE